MFATLMPEFVLRPIAATWTAEMEDSPWRKLLASSVVVAIGRSDTLSRTLRAFLSVASVKERSLWSRKLSMLICVTTLPSRVGKASENSVGESHWLVFSSVLRKMKLFRDHVSRYANR